MKTKKRLPLLLFFFFGLLNLNAQNYITFGQEYNYNVGDVFETKACSNNCTSTPPNYVITIILSKRYSMALDTIFYNDSIVNYTPPGCMSCSASFSTYTSSFYVTNLNSPSTDFSYVFGNTCPLKDTLIDSGLCSRKIWKKYPDPKCTDTCFEPIMSSSWVIEGCGGGYLTSFNPTGGPDEVDYNLIYYKKGADSCGFKYPLISGIDNLSPLNAAIKAYPVPANNLLYLQTSIPINGVSLTLYSLTGNMVWTSRYESLTCTITIPLNNLPNGMYALLICLQDGSHLLKKIAVAH